MDLNSNSTKNVKKIAIQVYFLIFILLNVADFLNILNQDLDFFKKLLSWSVIGYIFYTVSFSKIFVGQKHKIYDILYLVSFSIIAIPKALLFYVRSVPIENFFIFTPIIQFIYNNLQPLTINLSIILGLILTVIISTSLILNSNVRPNSILGSFNLKESYFKTPLKLLIIYFVAIFFGLIIFNMFMEWFALAVDAVILVLGLIYYLIQYIKHHTETKISEYLHEVSNTGNDFYKNLLEKFSNKKTFFVGVSFILTLHLVIDIGVFLFPYTFGFENQLYFSSIESPDRQHHPLFISFSEQIPSQLSKDNIFFQGDIIILIFITLLYSSYLFLFFSLLVLPFYIFYRNVQRRKIKFNKIFVVLFLSTVCLFIVSYAFPTINHPINIGKMDSDQTNVLGVDIYTNSYSYLNSSLINMEIIGLVIIYLTIILGLVYGYSKYSLEFNKLLYLIAVIFFIGYLSIYYYSYTENEVREIYLFYYDDNSNMIEIIDNEDEFKILKNNIESSSNTFKTERTLIDQIPIFITKTGMNYEGEVIVKTEYEFSENNHANYIINRNQLYSDRNTVNIIDNTIIKPEGTVIYRLEGQLEHNSQLVPLKNNFVIEKDKNQNTISLPLDLVLLSIEVIRLIFLSILYIFGTIAFLLYYIRRNLLEN